MNNQLSTSDLCSLGQLMGLIRIRYLWMPQHIGRMPQEIKDWEHKDFVKVLETVRVTSDTVGTHPRSGELTNAMMMVNFPADPYSFTRPVRVFNNSKIYRLINVIATEFLNTAGMAETNPDIWGALSECVMPVLAIPMEMLEFGAARDYAAEIGNKLAFSRYVNKYNRAFLQKIVAGVRDIDVNQLFKEE